MPYVLHWDGKTWSLIKTPDPGAFGSALEGITALSASDIWAVGQTQSSAKGPVATLTERFNGTSWSAAPSPDPGQAGNDELFAVAEDPSIIYEHAWRLGDLVIWDNCGCMHRVVPYDENSGRRMHRSTIMGDERVA